MVTETETSCCISLKHGTIIIGTMQSIFAFMFLVLSAAYAENPHELFSMMDSSVMPDLTGLRLILIIIAVVSACQCIFSILLIFAAETNRPSLILPWLVLNSTSVLIYLITTLVAVVHHTKINRTKFIVCHLILSTIVCLVAAFFTRVVYSYFKHLRRLNF